MLKQLVNSGILVFGLCGSAFSAEPLQMRKDAEGNIHFGNPGNPELCCMCQPAADYQTQPGKVLFSLPAGLKRAVSNDSVFLSPDGQAWYCEGVKEGGRLSQKCGLVPPGM